MIPGDVVVKIKQAKHKVFKRKGNDLNMKMAIPLRQALLGFERTISHLDGHDVKIRRDGVMKPGAVMKIEGEGMPHRDDPETYGDLYIEFSIDFPDTLSAGEQKAIGGALKKTAGDVYDAGEGALPRKEL